MKRFNKILLVVDPTEPCVPLMERSVAFAENSQAALTVVSVVPRVVVAAGLPEDGPVTLEVQAALVAEQVQRLEALAAPFRDRLSIRTKVLTGTPFLEVVREVLRDAHDLVIRAPENPGWLDRLFGSDDMHLLRKCPCPVWLARCDGSKSYRRILAAVDVDDSYPVEEIATRRAMNHEILALAGALALSEFAELHVVSVWEALGEQFLRGAFMNAPDPGQGRRRLCPTEDAPRERVGPPGDPGTGRAAGDQPGRHGHRGADGDPRLHHGQHRRVDPRTTRLLGARDKAAGLHHAGCVECLRKRALDSSRLLEKRPT